jgi:hypothetical protein
MAYLGTHIWWLEGFEAWRRTKIEVKLNINEKIKRVLGGWAVGSRIQDQWSSYCQDRGRSAKKREGQTV